MSTGILSRKPVTLLLLAAVAAMVLACSDPVPTHRTILDRQGTIKGKSQETLTIQVADGDRLQIVLGQNGLDVYLEFAMDGRDLGRYDSVTGRYGEDRAQLVVDSGGALQVTIGAVRFPAVSGTYRLLVSRISPADAAEEAFTRGSRVDQPLAPADRIRAFTEAAERYAGQGRAREEGLAALAALNLFNETASDSKNAVIAGERAVAALRKGGDRLLLAVALNGLAAANGEAKQAEQMSANFAEARRLYEAASSRIGVAEVRLYESVLNYKGQDSEELLTGFRQLAVECNALHELVCEAYALTDAAMMLRNRGDYATTFDYLYQALGLVEPSVDSQPFALISDNLAFTLRMIGDFDAAIFHHGRAMESFAKFGECSGTSRSLYGLGYSMLGIGESDQALRFYKLALDRSCTMVDLSRKALRSGGRVPSFKELCEQAVQSIALDEDDRAIASWVAWDLGNFARASSDANAALTCHEAGTRLATTPNHVLGTKLERVRDLVELRRIPEAQALYNEVEPDLARSHPWYRAQGLEVDAQLLAARSDVKDGIARFLSAANQYREAGNLEGVFSALSRRASLGLQARDTRANEYFMDADAALENVRLLSLDPAFSASLFASGRRIYEEWVESLLTEGASRSESRALEALAVSERSRARLLAQVARASQIGQDAREARFRSMAAGTLALLEGAETGESKANPISSIAAQDPAQRLYRSLGLDAARYDAKSLRASVSRLGSYRRALSKDTAIVEYLLGEKRSHAWVLRWSGVQRVDLGPAAPVRTAVAELHASIDRRQPEEVTVLALGRLYDLLLQPLQLDAKDAQIRIVADDVLHDVPFAALWDRHRGLYVVETASVGYLPSIQYSASREMVATSFGPGTALLIGDPVYESNDARQRCVAGVRQVDVAAPSIGLRRIPGSWREIEAIETAFRSQQQRAFILSGCAATRERILEGAERYRFIHFATHATADRVIPQRSAIHLSEWNEKGQAIPASITAADFLEHPLRADLVVLSGCSTAGGRQFSGEGSLGLSFSLLAGGSRQVISTLWPVADAASVNAMTTLYRGLLERNQTAAAALRSAQLEMLKGERWKSPRFWAAYSLLGT